jgi:DMSO/TMAO reductase YedYZ heme-binding membrane subunit
VNEHLWWYVARASGLLSWVLLTAAVLWGLALSGRLSRKPRPAWVLDLHRFLGGLSVVFVAIHLAALVADSYTHFGPSQLLVPLASTWRPGPVAWGVVAFYVMLAVEITSLLMRRLPRRIWRAVHLTSYLLFVTATVHLLAAGTDAGNPVVQWTVLAATFAVVNLTVIRAFSRPERRAPAAARLEGAPTTSSAPRSADGRARARPRAGTAA